jgi:hypothetical protein
MWIPHAVARSIQPAHPTSFYQAVGQICSTASMAHNLAQCQALVHNAVAAGAKVFFLFLDV